MRETYEKRGQIIITTSYQATGHYPADTTARMAVSRLPKKRGFFFFLSNYTQLLLLPINGFVVVFILDCWFGKNLKLYNDLTKSNLFPGFFLC